MFERVRRGEAFAIDDWLLPLDRNGYLENCWFTLSYSPIRDETGGVGGMLAVVAETTGRVEGERRLATLRDLARRAADATTPEQACVNAGAGVRRQPDRRSVRADLPARRRGRRPRAVSARRDRVRTHPGERRDGELGVGPTSPGGLARRRARRQRRSCVDDLPQRFGPLPGGPYDEPTHTAVLLPLSRPGLDHPYGVLVAGVSPRRALDDRYRDFFELAADHIATAISNAVRARGARRRAEALAEIDRAKTAFFSNVSHEFRTPLTLMLGPDGGRAGRRPEQALRGDDARDGASQPAAAAEAGQRAARLLAHRSRPRAGAATSRPTSARSRASSPARSARRSSRPACASSSTARRLPQPVYVDRDMWEKIVLNLLSNAFKFTFDGEIDPVALRERDGTRRAGRAATPAPAFPRTNCRACSSASTGSKGARSRTHEGSGIGLALVQELVRLHGGDIAVASRHRRRHHVHRRSPDRQRAPAAEPAGARRRRVVDDASAGGAVRRGGAALAAAGRGASRAVAGAPAPRGRGERILVADDNADMRDYLAQLLAATGDVETAVNGAAALERVRARRRRTSS